MSRQNLSAVQKRILVWMVILGLVAVVLVLTFRPQPVPVDLVTVAPGPMRVTVAEEGKTQVRDLYSLSAPVAGRVQRIGVEVGDAVVAGETILANIEPGDPTFLDPRSDAQARAAVQAAAAAKTLAEAGVAQAEAELAFAEAEWRRASELVGAGTISRRDFENAERALKSHRAALETARATLQMRLFELDQSRAQLLSPAETQQLHGKCKCLPITAPVDGRVLRVINQSERVVAAGEPLMEIADPADLEILVDFLSADAVQIRAGQPVIIEGWGGDEALSGRVRLVEPFGFTRVSALGIEEQRVNVIIDFTGPAAAFAPLGHGYQVEANVILWESDAALTVPLTALFRLGQEWAVFVEDGGQAEVRRVRIGQRNNLSAEVLEGLDPGERVVAHLSDRVADGVRITQRHVR